MAETNEEFRATLREIKQEIMKLLEKAGEMARESAGDISRWAGQAVGNDRTPSPLDQIERLGELRDKGFITDEEFQSKKTDLLKKIA